MVRATSSKLRRKRHKKILKLAKGYYGLKSKVYRRAKEAVLKSLTYAYRDRKNKKREFRALWITRISAAAKAHSVSYSKLIKGLKDNNILINRKILAKIAVEDKPAFEKIIELVK